MTEQSTPHTLLILGATSAIARAYVLQRLKTVQAAGGSLALILLARDGAKLTAEAADFEARGASVTCHELDLNISAVPTLSGMESVDEALLAYGSLTDGERAQGDGAYLAEQLAINFTSATLWLSHLAAQLAGAGRGRCLVIGSVAGDRGRMSNYAYGAAKAGLSAFVGGLAHRFGRDPHISFTLIKPGFVDTPMTAHIQPKGKLWAQPEDVAKAGERGLLKGRGVMYASLIWRGIMQIIRLLPDFVFHRTKL